MGPTWVLSAPTGPHVGPMNLVIRVNEAAMCWNKFFVNTCMLANTFSNFVQNSETCLVRRNIYIPSISENMVNVLWGHRNGSSPRSQGITQINPVLFSVRLGHSKAKLNQHTAVSFNNINGNVPSAKWQLFRQVLECLHWNDILPALPIRLNVT